MSSNLGPKTRWPKLFCAIEIHTNTHTQKTLASKKSHRTEHSCSTVQLCAFWWQLRSLFGFVEKQTRKLEVRSCLGSKVTHRKTPELGQSWQIHVARIAMLGSPSCFTSARSAAHLRFPVDSLLPADSRLLSANRVQSAVKWVCSTQCNERVLGQHFCQLGSFLLALAENDDSHWLTCELPARRSRL